MCCSPSKPVEHLVNTDGAPFHTLEPDLANERKVEEVTFALNPYTRHRNISPSAGEKTDTSLPHNIMQKLDRFDFLLSHSTCYLTHPPLLSATMGFPKYSFLNSCSYLCWAPCLFYTHHLLHCFIAVLMRGISFFNQSGIFRIILLTHQHCLWCTFCYSSKQAHHIPFNGVSLLWGLQKVVPEFICIAKCVEPLVQLTFDLLWWVSSHQHTVEAVKRECQASVWALWEEIVLWWHLRYTVRKVLQAIEETETLTMHFYTITFGNDFGNNTEL